MDILKKLVTDAAKPAAPVSAPAETAKVAYQTYDVTAGGKRLVIGIPAGQVGAFERTAPDVRSHQELEAKVTELGGFIE